MARESYQQSIGNPLQRDRLPASLPTIELPCRPAGQLETVAVILCWGVCLIASSMVAWLVVRQGHALPAPPLLVLGLVVFAMLYLIGDTPRPTEDALSGESTFVNKLAANINNTVTRIAFRVSLFVGAAWAILFAELPIVVHQLIASVAVGSLLRAFGQHFVGYCTASPMPRSAAWALRRRCDWILRGLATWPTIAVYLANSYGIGWDLVAGSVVAASILTGIVGRNRPLDILKAPWSALSQWCTYNLRVVAVPGLFIGPGGSWLQRLFLTATCSFLVSVSLAPSVWQGIQHVIPSIERDRTASSGAVAMRPDAESTFSLILVAPAVITLAMPMILCWPVLVLASVNGRRGLSASTWSNLVADMRTSPDLIERDSVYVAWVLEDGSPVLIPRNVFANHAHFLGDSGSGKTALGLAPLLEQLIQFGDSSFVTIDVKGDSLELLAAEVKGVEAARRLKPELPLPVKHFTNQPDLSTFAFNPLDQPYWDKLDPYVQTDILCGAFGLNYGTDYGAGFYSSANATVLHETIVAARGAKTFRELSNTLESLISAKGSKKLNPEIRSAGLHVQMVLKRLASIDALNVDSRSAPAEVVSQAIDLTKLFRSPEILHFHLSSTLSPGVAPEIARVAIYSLLCGAILTRERRCQVFLVIDEFQRIVANNLEYILQLARSMNVGVILANQSMEDLRTQTTDLIPALEANCRVRQWFAVSSSDDRARIVANSGETLEEFETRTISSEKGETRTYTQKLVPRVSQNDVLLTTDHPKRSILTLTRGAGYAQYGGFSVLVESDFHISVEEYEERRRMDWPAARNGAFVARDLRANTSPPVPPIPPTGPIVTIEHFDHRFKQDDDDNAAPLGPVGKPPRPGNGPRKPPTTKKGKKP